ncbi:MAG: hypothetical protein ACYC7D_14510 [Nitrososphaerales archaeon]
MVKWSKTRILALIIFFIPWVFWITSIAHASNSGFIEDKYAIQVMVLGGAISMVAGSVAALHE